jgi:hypothetical protein
MFASRTSPAFDALGAAATAAAMVVDGLLQPERLARLADFHRRDPSLPDVQEVLHTLTDTAFEMPREDERRTEIRRIVQALVVERLTRLAQRRQLQTTLRAQIESALRRIRSELDDSEGDAHTTFLVGEITRFLERPVSTAAEPWAPAAPPPGSPIGSLPHLAACDH